MPLQMVVWELTLRCNQACGHCGSRAGRARSDELTTPEALAVVDQLAEAAVEEVALIGGEAYLRADWDRIARAITARGMTCSMVTGGRGLDHGVARRATRAGIVNVAVSLDGLEAAHDTQRGWPGSWQAAREALRRLSAAGVATCVNTQINRHSVGDLEALVTELRHARIWAWRPALTVPMGRAADHWDWLLQPWEMLGLFPRLAALAARCRDWGIVFAPGDNLGYFGPYEALWRGGRSGHGHWPGCHAGTRALGIEADGTVKGCLSLPGGEPYAVGNLRDTPLRDLLMTKRLRDTAVRTEQDLWGFCRGCYYASECRAGCTWTGHALFGRAGNNPYCHHRVLVLGKRGLRERLEPIAGARGVPFDHGRFELIAEPIPEGAMADVQPC